MIFFTNVLKPSRTNIKALTHQFDWSHFGLPPLLLRV